MFDNREFRLSSVENICSLLRSVHFFVLQSQKLAFYMRLDWPTTTIPSIERSDVGFARSEMVRAQILSHTQGYRGRIKATDQVLKLMSRVGHEGTNDRGIDHASPIFNTTFCILQMSPLQIGRSPGADRADGASNAQLSLKLHGSGRRVTQAK